VQCVGTQHDFQSVMPIDQVVVRFQVSEVMVDRIVNKCNLNFFPRTRLLQTKQVSEIVVNQVLSGCEGGRMRKSGHVQIRFRHLRGALIGALLTGLVDELVLLV
jgi:hypothetical protein